MRQTLVTYLAVSPYIHFFSISEISAFAVQFRATIFAD